MRAGVVVVVPAASRPPDDVRRLWYILVCRMSSPAQIARKGGGGRIPDPGIPPSDVPMKTFDRRLTRRSSQLQHQPTSARSSSSVADPSVYLLAKTPRQNRRRPGGGRIEGEGSGGRETPTKGNSAARRKAGRGDDDATTTRGYKLKREDGR